MDSINIEKLKTYHPPLKEITIAPTSIEPEGLKILRAKVTEASTALKNAKQGLVGCMALSALLISLAVTPSDGIPALFVGVYDVLFRCLSTDYVEDAFRSGNWESKDLNCTRISNILIKADHVKEDTLVQFFAQRRNSLRQDGLFLERDTKQVTLCKPLPAFNLRCQASYSNILAGSLQLIFGVGAMVSFCYASKFYGQIKAASLDLAKKINDLQEGQTAQNDLQKEASKALKNQITKLEAISQKINELTPGNRNNLLLVELGLTPAAVKLSLSKEEERRKELERQLALLILLKANCKKDIDFCDALEAPCVTESNLPITFRSHIENSHLQKKINHFANAMLAQLVQSKQIRKTVTNAVVLENREGLYYKDRGSLKEKTSAMQQDFNKLCNA